MRYVTIAESHAESMQVATASHDQYRGSFFLVLMLTPTKMSRTLLMFSTMIIPTIQKITFIVLDVLVVLGRMALQLLSSQPKVRALLYPLVV